MMRAIFASWVAGGLLCLLLANQSQAASPTWVGGAGGNWSVGGNWSTPAAAPSNDGDLAVFNGSGGSTVNFNATVNPTNGVAGINVTAAQGPLTITSTVANAVYRIDNGGGISIAAGAGAFTFQGTAANMLRFHLGATGSGLGNVDVTFTNNSSNLASLDMGSNAANSRIQSAQHSPGNKSTVFFGGSGDWFYRGRLVNNPTDTSSPLAIAKNGSGTLTLQVEDPTGQVMYTGGLTLNAGTVKFTTVRDLGTGTFTINGGAIDNASALTLSSNNAMAWNGNFSFVGTNNLNLGTGAVALGASNVDVTVNANSLTVGGVISGAGNGITKKGAGTLILTAGSTYTGNTFISGGTLNLSATGAQIYSGAGTYDTQVITVSNGGTLVVGNFGKGTGSLTSLGNLTQTNAGSLVIDGGTLQFAATTSNPRVFTVGSNGATLSVNSGATLTLTSSANQNSYANNSTLTLTGAGTGQFAKVISGSGVAVSKTGSGNWTLSGNNTYTGGTNITSGTLRMDHASALGTGGVHLNGGTLDANGYALGMAITGNGTIASSTPITVSDVVSPGNSPGTITFTASVNFAGNYEWELASYSHTIGGGAYPVGTPGLGGDWDVFVIDGATFTIDPAAALTLKTGSLVPDSDAFWDEAHEWRIIDTINGGSIANVIAGGNLPSGNSFGMFSTVNNGGTELLLVWTPGSSLAVPEPGSLWLWGIALVLATSVGLHQRFRCLSSK